MRDGSRSRRDRGPAPGAGSGLAARAAHAAAGFLRSLVRAWRLLALEQRAAAVGAVLLAVSTLGDFSWVEAAIVLVCLAVLALLKKRADGAEFHLPFGDGAVVAAAGGWCAVLVLVRLFDRPAGQGLLALACAALLVGAGLRERARRPRDDLPLGARRRPAPPSAPGAGPPPGGSGAERPTEPVRPPGEEPTVALGPDDPPTGDQPTATGRPPSSSADR